MTKQTPDFEGDTEEPQPTRDLEVYNKATEPTTTEDEFLRRNNLGLGNYEESEIWQQLERFSDGMFGMAAFREPLLRKAIRQTKRRLAIEGRGFYDTHNMEAVRIEGWNDLDDGERSEADRRAWIRDRGEEIWGRMDDEQRLQAMEIITGIDEEWTPPHLRILLAQHEMSRSKGARLVDNLFGRKTEKKVISDSDEAARSLLGGGNR